MLAMKRYHDDVDFLISHVITHWDNYDFKEKTSDPERRVPRISLKGIRDIEISPKEVEHVEGFGYELFIRKYEVVYKDTQYIFKLTVDSHFGCVRQYTLSVLLYTCNEMKELYTERLGRNSQ